MYGVIVVDDEVLVREAICKNMDWNSLGYELLCHCENGKQAKEFLQSNHVDLVLTDICMPYMDGMELCEYICNNHRTTKMMIFSGYDEFEYAKKAIKYGVEEYMLKPITAAELTRFLLKLKKDLDLEREQQKKFAKISLLYNKNEEYIKAKVFYNLIHGTKSVWESINELEEVHVKLNSSAYRIAAIQFDHSSMIQDNEEMRQQRNLMHFIIHNISEEIVRDNQAGEVFLGNDEMVFILFSTNKPNAFQAVCKKVCEEIVSKVKQYFNTKVLVGIGQYSYSLSNLLPTYENALKALNYIEVLENVSVVDMDEISEHINESISISEELKAMELAVKLEDYNQIDQSIAAVVHKIRENYIIPYKANMYLHQIVRMLCELLGMSELLGREVYQQGEAIALRITELAFLDKIDCVRQFAYRVSNEIACQKNIGHKKLVIKAMDFIEHNYMKPDLSLNYVCDYLGISVSHFSIIFKNAYGETFMEALTRIRMGKAKELIENTDMKNYEIAEKVGFENPHYFSVSFKKATGKTPKEYAQEVR